MSRLGILHGQTGEPTDAALIERAQVATTPTDLADDVYVVLELDVDRQVGPVLGWRTTPEALWPVRGNDALVISTPQGDYWFIGWEPTP